MTGNFSVVILTLNEERNLPTCLSSLRGCQDVLVLDSGSTDRTSVIALEWGARVLENPFNNFADQRNYAHRHGDFKFPWVFHLDADEQFTPELFEECSNWSDNHGSFDGAWSAPKMLWKGNWMRRCTDFPAWQARWVRARGFEFIQAGHGQREHPRMRMTKLRSCYLHDMSTNGTSDWLSKHASYAQQEARDFLAAPAPAWSALLSRDALVRRRAIKHLSGHLPFRPQMRWIYQYILRGGFLDGPAAREYCGLLAQYDAMIQKEIKSMRANALNQP
jgi:glycosyltransferase involved in cell wall biosynthesis